MRSAQRSKARPVSRTGLAIFCSCFLIATCFRLAVCFQQYTRLGLEFASGVRFQLVRFTGAGGGSPGLIRT